MMIIDRLLMAVGYCFGRLFESIDLGFERAERRADQLRAQRLQARAQALRNAPIAAPSRVAKRSTMMSSKCRWTLIALAFLALIAFAFACAPNYSTGSRVGIVTKLSQKGIVWKSYEGEMLVALPVAVAGATNPELFLFNVSPSVAPAVEEALRSGKRVELVYREWWAAPPTIDNAHVVIAVKEVR